MSLVRAVEGRRPNIYEETLSSLKRSTNLRSTVLCFWYLFPTLDLPLFLNVTRKYSHCLNDGVGDSSLPLFFSEAQGNVFTSHWQCFSSLVSGLLFVLTLLSIHWGSTIYPLMSAALWYLQSYLILPYRFKNYFKQTKHTKYVFLTLFAIYLSSWVKFLNIGTLFTVCFHDNYYMIAKVTFLKCMYNIPFHRCTIIYSITFFCCC